MIVNDDRIFIFGWTIALIFCSQELNSFNEAFITLVFFTLCPTKASKWIWIQKLKTLIIEDVYLSHYMYEYEYN